MQHHGQGGVREGGDGVGERVWLERADRDMGSQKQNGMRCGGFSGDEIHQNTNQTAGELAELQT
jgi:hypothetical protein